MYHISLGGSDDFWILFLSLCWVFGDNNFWEVDPYNSDNDDGDGDDDPWSVGVGDESQTFNQSPGPQSLTQLLLLLTYSYSTLTRDLKILLKTKKVHNDVQSSTCKYN